MIDLSKGPVPLRATTPAELRDSLARELPSPVEVKLVEGKKPSITIREGMWRGMALLLGSGEKGLTLSGYFYEIPGFGAKVLLFVLSVVIFSVILMAAVAIAVGEFVPTIGGVGGIAGFMMYNAVQSIVIRNVSKGWAPTTERAIANVSA